MTQEAKNVEATEEVKDTATTKKDTPAKTEEAPKWEGSFTDIGNTQRNIKITEADGTTIDVNVKWPGKKAAENAQGQANAQQITESGDRVIRSTMGDYHQALFAFFGKPIVDGKASAQNIGWDFFDEHSNKTYEYLMDQADSFLVSSFDAD